MQNPSIRGKVIAIGETQTSQSGSFQWRECVVDTGYNWPCPIPTRWTQERTTKLDGIAVGDVVLVEYRLSGREYNGRYFVDVQGLEITSGNSSNAKPAATTPATPAPLKQDPPQTQDDDLDLPF